MIELELNFDDPQRVTIVNYTVLLPCIADN